MTIYILDNDPKQCAQYLDDLSLDKMIKDIAQVLVQTCYWENGYVLNGKWKELPLKPDLRISSLNKCVDWARECKANYSYLVELGFCLYFEWLYRWKKKPKGHDSWIKNSGYKVSKSYEALIFARDNVPDLPKFPLIHVKSHACGLGIDREGNNVRLRFVDTILARSEYEISSLPLVMPKKFLYVDGVDLHDGCIGYHEQRIQAYRNYYQAKLKQSFKQIEWTMRFKPSWLEI